MLQPSLAAPLWAPLPWVPGLGSCWKSTPSQRPRKPQGAYPHLLSTSTPLHPPPPVISRLSVRQVWLSGQLTSSPSSNHGTLPPNTLEYSGIRSGFGLASDQPWPSLAPLCGQDPRQGEPDIPPPPQTPSYPMASPRNCSQTNEMWAITGLGAGQAAVQMKAFPGRSLHLHGIRSCSEGVTFPTVRP